jgi:hypothetical protein
MVCANYVVCCYKVFNWCGQAKKHEQEEFRTHTDPQNKKHHQTTTRMRKIKMKKKTFRKT